MLNLLSVILQYMLPVLAAALPAALFLAVRNRHTAPAAESAAPVGPDVAELEKRLSGLLEINRCNEQIASMQKKLQQSPSGIIASYLKMGKKDLKGFHLFQHIFALLKNRTDDAKIIKLLRRYLPSCATSHLYAVLRSFKIFLNLCRRDRNTAAIWRDLNNNRVRSALLYLEQQINRTLNRFSETPEEARQSLLDRAAIYSLVFASFSEFYDREATAKILRLALSLSPGIFRYWHSVPHRSSEPFPFNDTLLLRLEDAGMPSSERLIPSPDGLAAAHSQTAASLQHAAGNGPAATAAPFRRPHAFLQKKETSARPSSSSESSHPRA